MEFRLLLAATNPLAPDALATDVGRLEYSRYLVLFGESDSGFVGNPSKEHDAFVQTLRNLFREPVEVDFGYTRVLNGIALQLTDEQADHVRTMPSVTTVLKDASSQLQENSAEQTGAAGVWDGSALHSVDGTLGEGILIGVIDSGIDFDNASFAEIGPNDGYIHTNPFGNGNYLGLCDPSNSQFDATLPCNNKIVGAWNYTEDAVNAEGDADHGTSVAGIAAGNFTNAIAPGANTTIEISGVAPHANIIAYDVCTTLDDCSNAAIMAAVDQAIDDGVDVINLSIGGDTEDPWNAVMAKALLNAFDAGIFVAVSAGNEGPGRDTITAPADAPWVTGVAAVGANTTATTSISVFGDAVPELLMEIPVTAGENIVLPQTIGPFSLLHAADVSPGDPLGSSPYPAGTFTDRIALIDRGDSLFETKVTNAHNAGAAAVIMINNVAGPNIVMAGVDGVPIPSVLISQAQGTALRQWLHENPGATVQLNAEQTQDLTIVAGFSSRGPNTQVDTLAPNIAAPGDDNLVLAPVASNGNDNYDYFSGTSAASPHIAGAAALLIDLHPDWSPAEVRSALETTAISGSQLARDPGLTPADPFDVGSGLVDISRAANAGIVLDESTANFAGANPSAGGHPSSLNLASFVDSNVDATTTWTRTIRSTQTTTVTWTASFITDEGLTLSLNQSTIVLGAGETASVSLSADITGATSNAWLFGELILTPDDDIPAAQFPVAVRPTPSAGVVIRPSGSGTDVSELGATDTYEISLSTFASGNVALRVTAPAGVEVSTDGATFSSATTIILRDESPHTVTVRANNDAIDEGWQTVLVTHSIITPVVDSNYDTSTRIEEVVVSVYDDDVTPGLVITESSGDTSVSESGTQDTLAVSLRLRPVSDVVLLINGNDATEASVDTSTLTFTPLNWNIPQTVIVTGLDDSDQDGDVNVALTVNVDVSESADEYDSVASGVVNVTVFDNEVPAPEPATPKGAIEQLRPVFEWTAVTNAVSYDLFIRQIGSEQDPIENPTVTGTTYTPESDLGVGNYQYWVRANYATAPASPWIGASFQISVAPVIVPLNAKSGDATPTITWNSISGAEAYEVYIFNTTTQQLLNDRNVTSNSFTPAEALGLGKYRIWIRVIGAGNYAAAWSAAVEYSVGAQLLSPVIPTFESRPTFRWTTPTGTATFQLFIRNPDGSVSNLSDLTAASYTPAEDLPAGRYFWWVRGFTAEGAAAAWSDRGETYIGGRTTVTAPGESTSDASPEFTWRPVEQAESYEIFLNRTDVPSHILRTEGISGTSFETGVLEDGDYAVWVRAKNPEGRYGFWSPRAAFSVSAGTANIEAEPAISELVTFTTTPTISWTATSNAASFEVHMFNGMQTIKQIVEGATEWTTPDLGVDTWQWWVRAFDAERNAGPFSQMATIDTSGRAVGLSPSGTTHHTPTFTWTPVVGADHYFLQIDDLGTGDNQVVREDQLTEASYTPLASLTPGEYRFWVRAISNGNPGAGFWSLAVDFTVT